MSPGEAANTQTATGGFTEAEFHFAMLLSVPIRLLPSLAMRGSNWLLLLIAWGCSPGEISPEQRREFRAELERWYGDGGTGDVTDDSPEPDPSPSPEPDPSPSPEPDPSPSPAPQPSGTIPDCVSEVFASGCAGTGCHYDSAFNFPPDLERDDLFEKLTTDTSLCASAPLYVDLDSPQDSLMLLKITGNPPSGCGTPMPPQTAPQLDAQQKQCLEDWFDDLAK